MLALVPRHESSTWELDLDQSIRNMATRRLQAKDAYYAELAEQDREVNRLMSLVGKLDGCMNVTSQDLIADMNMSDLERVTAFGMAWTNHMDRHMMLKLHKDNLKNDMRLLMGPDDRSMSDDDDDDEDIDHEDSYIYTLVNCLNLFYYSFFVYHR